MNDFKQQMPQFDIDPKKIGKYVAMGVVGLVLVVLFNHSIRNFLTFKRSSFYITTIFWVVKIPTC